MYLSQRRKGAKAERKGGKENQLSSLLCVYLCAFAPLREIFLLLILTSPCRAADPPPAGDLVDDSAKYTVDTLLESLDNPAALALRPGAPAEGPFELYLSESGAGRVLRLSTANPKATSPVVTDFPLSQMGDDPAVRVGPLGLEFISPNRLAVGTGGLATGADLIHVYALPEDNSPLAHDKVDHSAGPVPASGRTETGEGDFTALAKTDDALFVAPAAGDQRGWILKAILDANRLADLQPFIATRTVAGAGRPRAIVVNPKPNYHYLVAAEAGQPTADRDSRITFYSPTSGELALNLNTGLRDIVALAYSPTGDLYAADFSTSDPREGGVYRIEATQINGRESCRPIKIARALRPTALLFTPDGALHATALGDRTNPNDPPTGVLLKITPKPDTPKL